MPTGQRQKFYPDYWYPWDSQVVTLIYVQSISNDEMARTLQPCRQRGLAD